MAPPRATLITLPSYLILLYGCEVIMVGTALILRVGIAVAAVLSDR